MSKPFLLIVFAMLLAIPLHADEGMWLPALIQKLNIKDMQGKGFGLTAEDIYSINQSSLKDAVVSIGGCTAEMISPEGLMLTNHHCAFNDIQQHSSIEHDYLRDGFWAKTKVEELPVPMKMARFLIRVEDVTEKVLGTVKDEMTFNERQKAVAQEIADIEKEAIGDSHYNAQVVSFFESNQYYLFIYETFRDVRLVGAPPQSLGKFGGETDNWVWPRHTCDFAIYRVYSGPDGKPASYSKDNIPLKPKHFFPVSLKGIREGDYAMILGYPGRTKRYRTSTEVQYTLDVANRVRIDVREKKLDIIKKYMATSQKARIQYASKYASSSNYYKYSIGQNRGLISLDVVNRKKAEEELFSKWVASSPERTARYGKALGLIKDAYDGLKDEIAQEYLNEALIGGAEIFIFAYRARALYNLLEKPEENRQRISQICDNMSFGVENFYKDYDPETDQKLAATLMKLYADRVSPEYYPDFFRTVLGKYKGDFNKFASRMYAGSVFPNRERMEAFLKNPSRKLLEKDMLFKASGDIFDLMRKLGQETEQKNIQLEEGRHLYLAGLMEMYPDKVFYPDANSTMRITYGNIDGYSPSDGIYYKHFTTIKGYTEKGIPGDTDFDIPERLKELINNADFGRYADENGSLVTCFISNNDITGGNSGSPVLNSNGELIGIAFDGNWEAMSGDIAFENGLQRTINVDIRFVLWVVDKYAGATHLLKEMTILEK